MLNTVQNIQCEREHWTVNNDHIICHIKRFALLLTHWICKIHRLNWITHLAKGVVSSTFFFFFVLYLFFEKEKMLPFCRFVTQRTWEMIHTYSAGLKGILFLSSTSRRIFFFCCLHCRHWSANSLLFIIISLFCQNKQIGFVSFFFFFLQQCH